MLSKLEETTFRLQQQQQQQQQQKQQQQQQQQQLDSGRCGGMLPLGAAFPDKQE